MANVRHNRPKGFWSLFSRSRSTALDGEIFQKSVRKGKEEERKANQGAKRRCKRQRDGIEGDSERTEKTTGEGTEVHRLCGLIKETSERLIKEMDK